MAIPILLAKIEEQVKDLESKAKVGGEAWSTFIINEQHCITKEHWETLARSMFDRLNIAWKEIRS